MKVNEMFDSIQGEGPAAGQPARFIRLSGCNLNCEGCDTLHNGYTDLTIEYITKRVKTGFKSLIVITGGEPLLQMEEVTDLAAMLHHNGFVVDLETNGSLNLTPSQFRNVVISPKKGIDVDFDYYIYKLGWANTPWIKFVMGWADWCWSEDDIKEFIKTYPTMKGQIYVMPFGRGMGNAQTVWDFAVENQVRYSDRLQWRVTRK